MRRPPKVKAHDSWGPAFSNYSVGGDAMAVAGNERDAIRLLRSQLERQGESMDEDDVKRTRRALSVLRKGHGIKFDPKATGYGKFSTRDARSKRILSKGLGRGRYYLTYEAMTFDEEDLEKLRKNGFIIYFK